MLKKIAKPVSMILAISFYAVQPCHSGCKAEMIGTETAVHLASKEKSRATVTAFLERDDVQQTHGTAGCRRGRSPKTGWPPYRTLSFCRLHKKSISLPAGGDGCRRSARRHPSYLF